MKDHGKLCYFLGLEIPQSTKGILMHQKKYVLDLLKEVGMIGSNDADTPMEIKLNYKVIKGNQ